MEEQMNNKSTEDLWKAIKKMGQFTDSYYDKNIEEDMKKELRLNEDDSLQELQPEAVVSAFFKVVSPLSLMYEDILCLFEQCKANKSLDHLEIVFDSSKVSSIKFNIKHFIEARQKLKNVEIYIKRISVNEKKIDHMWSLRSPKDFRKKVEIHSSSFRQWASEYWENENRWPEVSLDFEEIVNCLPISELLLRCYECWQALYNFYISTDRNDRPIGGSESHYNELEKKLLWNQTDHWTIQLLFNLYYYAENYLSFSESDKERIKNELVDFLQAFYIIDDYVEKNIHVWQDFLKLPVWEKRHEIYSIWIFTQIITAFPEECITFKIENGTLVFPFSGACLASVKLNQKVFDIWTEFRSEAVIKPIGKSRIRAIQPDYSIVNGDENDIRNTVAVIECKQYKKASNKNFREAIIDYALNRPNAKVFLVDYGEVNCEHITSTITEISKTRYEVFSKCRPQNKSAVQFSEMLKLSLYQNADMFEVVPSSPISFVLMWNGISEEQDLDLHMKLTKDQKIQFLNYRSQEINNSEYGGDIRKSPGVEWIKINKWEQGVYDIGVNVYSDNVKFTEAKPVLIIKAKNIMRIIEINPNKDIVNGFNWWHILKIDTKSNIGFIVNCFEKK